MFKLKVSGSESRIFSIT